MTEATFQGLASELQTNPELREMLLRDPIETLRAVGVSEGEIAHLLASILTGEVRVEVNQSRTVHILSPWPPVGSEELRLTEIDPRDASRGVAFSFVVRGEDLDHCDLVAFRCDDARQYLAYDVELTAPTSLAGNVLIKKPGTYTVIVGNKRRFGFLRDRLVVR